MGGRVLRTGSGSARGHGTQAGPRTTQLAGVRRFRSRSPERDVALGFPARLSAPGGTFTDHGMQVPQLLILKVANEIPIEI